MGITFYPTISKGELGIHAQHVTRALLPASSWAGPEVKRYGHVRKALPVPRIPPAMVDVAADCGGFVAMTKWKGEYKYSVEQYVAWLSGFTPKWAALRDFCCEDEITSGQPGIVRARQDATTMMALSMWGEYQSSPWAWVPTIQGWHTKEYHRHVQDMRPLITEMYQHYGPDSAFRVGIGTLCARASASMIREVVTMVARELPGVPLHLWGVKLSVFKSPVALPEQVASADSAAWNGMFKTGRNAWKTSGLSQRKYGFDVALRNYEAKLYAALSQPKQMR